MKQIMCWSLISHLPCLLRCKRDSITSELAIFLIVYHSYYLCVYSILQLLTRTYLLIAGVFFCKYSYIITFNLVSFCCLRDYVNFIERNRMKQHYCVHNCFQAIFPSSRKKIHDFKKVSIVFFCVEIFVKIMKTYPNLSFLERAGHI